MHTIAKDKILQSSDWTSDAPENPEMQSEDDFTISPL